MFISRSQKVVSSLISLWGIACLTCMQNVGAWRILREFSSDAILRCGHLVCHDLGHVKCGLWQKHWNCFNKCHVRLAVQLDPVTFAGVLNASASVEGRCSHDQIIQGGCD